nr:glutamate decarboxylase 4 [Quercus suber]
MGARPIWGAQGCSREAGYMEPKWEELWSEPRAINGAVWIRTSHIDGACVVESVKLLRPGPPPLTWTTHLVICCGSGGGMSLCSTTCPPIARQATRPAHVQAFRMPRKLSPPARRGHGCTDVSGDEGGRASDGNSKGRAGRGLEPGGPLAVAQSLALQPAHPTFPDAPVGIVIVEGESAMHVKEGGWAALGSGRQWGTGLYLACTLHVKLKLSRTGRKWADPPAPTSLLPSLPLTQTAANMVHLGRVSTDAEIEDKSLAKHLGIDLDAAPEEDQFTSSVYGTRFAALDLPKHEMPDNEMPREVAYRMINHDNTDAHSLASFVTTYMEDEAEKLMVEAFSKNFIDYEEYPVSADIQNRCVSMIARLFNVPTHDADTNAMGTSTIGSSEAIMLATLAMKKRWANKRKAEGKDYSRPNIIMNSAVQVCWEKAARYFDVEEKYVYCTNDRYVIDPEEAVALVDENTIGICSILGTTYTGEYEDTKAINDLLVKKGIDCPIHVDAASGGFVAPFVNPNLVWDFRLEKVVSINVSGHKYGLVYPGVGWVVWRDPEFLPKGENRFL